MSTEIRRILAPPRYLPLRRPPSKIAPVTATVKGAADVRRQLHFPQPSAEHETWMLMSGIIALCALVVVAVLVLPVFGPRVALMTAVIAAVAIVLVCYLICIPRAFARTAFDTAEAICPEPAER